MSAYAILAKLDDDGKEKPRRKKKAKPAASPPNSAAAPAMTAAQKEILARRRAAENKRKEERKKVRDLEERCYYAETDGCDKKRHGDWPYCNSCYFAHTGACTMCKGPTYLKDSPLGELHARCTSCRKGSDH